MAVDAGIGLGTHLPVHCTAAGKALLARLPAAEQKETVTRLRLVKCGPKTIATKTALRTELARVLASEGVAMDDEELFIGRRALAAVVVDGEGAAIAAVELAVPANTYTPQRLVQELGPKVAATARHIAAGLG